jgi:hypothetical protein
MLMTIAPKRASMNDPATAAFPAASFVGSAALVLDYLTGAFQGRILFLDLLRWRGNEEVVITAQPTAAVLRCDPAA